jgi:hypothetical protein
MSTYPRPDSPCYYYSYYSSGAWWSHGRRTPGRGLCELRKTLSSLSSLKLWLGEKTDHKKKEKKKRDLNRFESARRALVAVQYCISCRPYY